MSEIITGIRPAQATDSEVLAVARLACDVRRLAYNIVPGTPAYHHMVEEPLTDEKLAELAGWIGQPYGLTWVAETSERNIGGAAIGWRDQESQTDRFEYFFVDQRFQGQGRGSEMIDAFCSRAIYRQLTWLVYDNTGAERLYARHGFRWCRTYRDRAIDMRFKGMERHQIGDTSA